MKNTTINFKGMNMKLFGYLPILFTAIILLSSGCSQPEDSRTHKENTGEQKEYWTCSMHPQVRTDGPGSCPICGMDLIKKVDSEAIAVNPQELKNMVMLTGNKQALANVSTVIVKKENLQEEITAYSYLDFVENNRKTISARFNGRIEKLLVDKTGDNIKKGQPLFEIYSPDLVHAQNEYLIARNNSSANPALLDMAKKKLEIFGLTNEQIDLLETAKETKITFTYYSPISGTVIEKKIQEGDYVNEGTIIYDVAELSTLWNIAEVYENNLANVKIGNKVKLRLRAYPGEEFKGRITFIYPVVNSQTRTVKVRSEFQNYRNKLKPQMYGETIFNIAGGDEGLLVPADAVIITGKSVVVWVKTGDGMFEARNVKIGNRFGSKYQIVSGVNEGEEIAATGGFLIDSESQLRTAEPTGHQHSDSK